jgi:hypothetical protein
MFYVIADTLLKVALNTNRTGQHVLRYEHGDQFYWCLTTLSTICQVLRITLSPVLFVFKDTFNNVSGIMYNMVTSFIGV